jgi:HK97 family phage major capsid protein/HK97 family phage prohead protease
MNELERILALPIEERKASDLEYLEKYAEELSAEQKTQLEKEKTTKSPMCKMPDETKKECVARKIPEIMRDNPGMTQDQAIAEAESMCSKDCKTKEDEEKEKAEAEEKAKKEAEEKEEAEKLAKEAKAKELVGKKIDIDLTVETKDLGQGEVEAVISSGVLDRHGEKIDVAGISTKQYMKNPIVAWAHNYDLPPIGKAIKVWKEGEKLMGRMKFAIAENPMAKTVYELIQGGFLNAVSIGFIPLEMDGNTYTKSEMIEFSVVPVPANPEALIFAKKKGLDISKIMPHTKEDMNLEALLAKIKDEGIDALTLAEVKFIKASEKDLTENQKAELAEILKVEDKDADLKKYFEEKIEALKKELDKPEVKNINLSAKAKDADGKIKKEYNFFHYVKAVQNKDFRTYEETVGKDAMNTTEDGDLLPPIEFIAEVERLEEAVGVSLRDATVRRSTNGSGIKYLFGADDVEIFDTAEGEAKSSTSLSYTPLTLLWRKFAAILPITDELSEDSAIDLWNDATKRFARAYAKKADFLVFLETDGTSPKNKGILNVDGTNEVTLDSGMSSLDYDNIVDMVYGVPTDSAANGKFYFHRTVLGEVMKIKDDEQRPLWQPAMADGTPATILGKRYELVDELPAVGDDEPGLAFMVFGDLRYTTLGMRTDMVIRIFDQGTVGDPDEESEINLLTQDAQAMRAVQRMNAVVRFPAAYSVAKTSGGS